MDVTFSKIDNTGGTRYAELPIYHMSIINVKNTKDNYSVNWCFLILLYLP